jgi:hypothetical protein
VTHEEFLQLLGLPNPQELVRAIIEALLEVYRFNADRQEPEMGDDEQWFGFSVYRNGWHRIEMRLARVAGVRTSRPKNSLQIDVDGGARFHVYRGGNDETYDIYSYDWSTGTKTKVSLAERNSRQLSLFEEEEERDRTWHLGELAIVHAGNAEDGLTGVWAGAPVLHARDGSQWEWVVTLYQPGDAGKSERLSDVPRPPRFDQSPEPDLDLSLLGETERAEEAE